jgi:uncharacterized protein (TIGR03083 family)
LPDGFDPLAEFERTAADLAAILEIVAPAAAVPSCPGWTVADLAEHVGAGQRWAASILLSSQPQKVPAVLRTAISWSDWYAGTTAALVAAIKAVDPAEPCWNFSPGQQFAGFWTRRRLHETAVHLVDALQAAADPAADADSIGTGRPVDQVIPPAVAADGVDEVFEVFLPRMLARGFPPVVTRQVGVRAVDTGHEWTLTPAGQGEPSTVGRSGATGDVIVSGTALELYLALWRRLPAGSLRLEGDTLAAAGLVDGRVTP